MRLTILRISCVQANVDLKTKFTAEIEKVKKWQGGARCVPLMRGLAF